jgi:photosystem II stability/assembly factor-like uncharacterized protein
MKQKYILEKLSSALFYASILIFLIAFNFQNSKTGGWYQQWLPGGLGDAPVKDMVFTDSLTGWIIAGSPYLLKTTNGGDNWFVNQNFGDTVILNSMEFLGRDTIILGEGFSIYKSTNGGLNFLRYKFPPISFYAEDIAAFSYDSIWVTGGDGIHGGIYLTTNGGLNWVQKYLYNQNQLDKIYFYNHRIGFCCSSNQTLKTTNGGNNWFEVLAGEGYTDIHFIDSLVGWKNNITNTQIKKTTNGGLNWTLQTLPPEGGHFSLIRIHSFHNINKDTIWGVGGEYQLSDYTVRGMIFKTTNGGINWGYQLPDTIQINIPRYRLMDFINNRIGWAYANTPTGVHTIVGGNDTTFYTNIKEQITNVTSVYELKQNFPNPFNPKTVIGYSLLKNGFVKIIVYDILGKELATLVNENKKAGNYETQFSINQFTNNGNSSGIYFYTLFVDGNRIDTKKMLLIK